MLPLVNYYLCIIITILSQYIVVDNKKIFHVLSVNIYLNSIDRIRKASNRCENIHKEVLGMLLKKLGVVCFASVLSLGVLAGCNDDGENEDMEDNHEEQDMEDGE
jgi:hypothetical protein